MNNENIKKVNNLNLTTMTSNIISTKGNKTDRIGNIKREKSN